MELVYAPTALYHCQILSDGLNSQRQIVLIIDTHLFPPIKSPPFNKEIPSNAVSIPVVPRLVWRPIAVIVIQNLVPLSSQISLRVQLTPPGLQRRCVRVVLLRRNICDVVRPPFLVPIALECTGARFACVRAIVVSLPISIIDTGIRRPSPVSVLRILLLGGLEPLAVIHCYVSDVHERPVGLVWVGSESVLALLVRRKLRPGVQDSLKASNMDNKHTLNV